MRNLPNGLKNIPKDGHIEYPPKPEPTPSNPTSSRKEESKTILESIYEATEILIKKQVEKLNKKRPKIVIVSNLDYLNGRTGRIKEIDENLRATIILDKKVGDNLTEVNLSLSNVMLR